VESEIFGRIAAQTAKTSVCVQKVREALNVLKWWLCIPRKWATCSRPNGRKVTRDSLIVILVKTQKHPLPKDQFIGP